MLTIIMSGEVDNENERRHTACGAQA